MRLGRVESVGLRAEWAGVQSGVGMQRVRVQSGRCADRSACGAWTSVVRAWTEAWAQRCGLWSVDSVDRANMEHAMWTYVAGACALV